MKILISSHFFHPSIGGIEEVSRILADEFTRAGHEVRVVTQTAATEDADFPYEIIRHPTPGQLLGLARWCDVCFHNNVSLRTAWPLLFFHRPWFITHATWTRRADGRIAFRDRLKRFIYRFATNLAISQAMADHLPVASVIVGNPYRAELFRVKPGIERNNELVFLGRLVSDKGVDILLRALAQLGGGGGLKPKLAIIGQGPEELKLRGLAEQLGLRGQVEFLGARSGEKLVSALNTSQILVAPSRWAEPFGLVALEGIACGCAVVGSTGGGLKDAIGPCGATFENGSVEDLAAALKRLLTDRAQLEAARAAAPGHLGRFYPATVARHYLQLFAGALAARGRLPQTGAVLKPSS